MAAAFTTSAIDPEGHVEQPVQKKSKPPTSWGWPQLKAKPSPATPVVEEGPKIDKHARVASIDSVFLLDKEPGASDDTTHINDGANARMEPDTTVELPEPLETPLVDDSSDHKVPQPRRFSLFPDRAEPLDLVLPAPETPLVDIPAVEEVTTPPVYHGHDHQSLDHHHHGRIFHKHLLGANEPQKAHEHEHNPLKHLVHQHEPHKHHFPSSERNNSKRSEQKPHSHMWLGHELKHDSPEIHITEATDDRGCVEGLETQGASTVLDKALELGAEIIVNIEGATSLQAPLNTPALRDPSMDNDNPVEQTATNVPYPDPHVAYSPAEFMEEKEHKRFQSLPAPHRHRRRRLLVHKTRSAILREPVLKTLLGTNLAREIRPSLEVAAIGSLTDDDGVHGKRAKKRGLRGGTDDNTKAWSRIVF